MKLNRIQAYREARQRNQAAKESGSDIRHKAVRTRHWCMQGWKYKVCWTVILVT